MPSETTPKPHHTAAVSGPANFNWDAVEVEVTGDLALRVRFADGLTGQVRFQPSHLTGVFEALKERALFTQVFVDHGAIAWPGDIDSVVSARPLCAKLQWRYDAELQMADDPQGQSMQFSCAKRRQRRRPSRNRTTGGFVGVDEIRCWNEFNFF